MEQIIACGTRGGGLTRQLLSHARPQALDTKVLDPSEVVSATLRLLRGVVLATIEMEEALDGGPWRTRADATQLQQVVSNLILNASHAMPQGGTIRVECSGATLSEAAGILPTGDYVCIEVRDTGEGMSRATQDRIFEPFFTTRPEGHCTGLGLSVALDVARRHNGDLRIESTEGVGTRATLWLPRASADQALESSVASPPEPLFGGGRRVLLVEDESMVRVITGGLLRRWGFEVIEADNGVKALELARSLEGPVDLLLTDVIMPRMTGPELVAQLRKVRRDVNVLYVSGYSSELVHSRFAVGADTGC